MCDVELGQICLYLYDWMIIHVFLYSFSTSLLEQLSTLMRFDSDYLQTSLFCFTVTYGTPRM